jgi:endonuclease/exonuclease/phosphatase (EEP) superfamily protein YafD
MTSATAGRVTTRRRPGGPVVTGVLATLTGLVLTLTFVRLVPFDAVTPFAQLVGLTPWVGALGVLTLLGAALARRRLLALLLVPCLVAQAVWVAPFFAAGPTAAPAGTAPLRVAGVNAWLGQADADAVVRMVHDEGVDVLAVTELTTDFRERLVDAGIEDALPHHVDDKVGTGSPGSGLWSVRPLSDVDTTEFSTFGMPSAVVDVEGVPVRVTAVHPVPPLPELAARWHAEMLRLAGRAHDDPTAQVLVGDFNSTYDHATFRDLLGDRFHDATRSAGRGLNLSWSLRPGTPAVLDLDHVVTDRENVVTDVASVLVPGTDHRVIVATVHVPIG